MPLAIDAGAARDLLRARGHDPRDLTLLSGGEWSAAFAFREGEGEYVVRFHERRDDLEKDRYAQRWTAPRLRTGRIVEIGDLAEGAYGISERVRGVPLDDLDEDGMRAALPSLLAALDACREADLSGTAGYGLWHGDARAAYPSWRAWLLGEETGADRMAQGRAALVRANVGVHEFDAGLTRMCELLHSCPEERHLVHNDLLNFNVFAAPDGVVLLDWGASIFGDFLYDVALLTVWWPRYGRWGGIDVRAEAERHYAKTGLAVPNFAERLRCYQLHIGIDHIRYQVQRGRLEDAGWTARRTLGFVTAPL